MKRTIIVFLCIVPSLVLGLNWSYANGYDMEFDGAQSQYVHFPSNQLIPPDGDFTLSVWVRVGSEQVGQVFEVLAQRNHMYSGIWPYWDYNGAHFYLGRGSNGNIRVGDDWQDTGVPFPDDSAWHYFTIVKSSSDTKLYIDGRFRSSKGGAIRNPSGNESWIGKQFVYGLLWQYTEYFTGWVDEIKVWNTALTREQLREKMHDTLSWDEPNLFTYIQFNESSSSIVEAHQANDAVIQGTIVNGASYVNEVAPAGMSSVDHFLVENNGTYTSSNGVTLHVTGCIGVHTVYIHKMYQRTRGYDFADDYNYAIYDYDDYGISHWNVDQIDFEPTHTINEYYELFPEHLDLKWMAPAMDGIWIPCTAATDFDPTENLITFNTDFDHYLDGSINPRMGLYYGIVPQGFSSIASLDPQDEEITGLNPDFTITIEHSYLYPNDPCYINSVNGNAYLYEGDTLLESIPLDMSMVTDASITFTPSYAFIEGGYYNIRLDHGALHDDQDIDVLGITDDYTWNFTTSGGLPQEGKMLNFSGADANVTIANQSAFNIPGDMTIESWFKINAFDRAWQAIVTKGDSSWGLHRYSSTSFLNFVAGGSNISGTTDVHDGKWHHVAAVKDGNELRLYVDGKLDASGSCSATTPANTFPVMIGNNSQQTSRRWNGYIDDVRIWSSARSIDDIRLNMHHPIAETNPNLVGYWKFDEDTGEPCYDWAGNNNGTKSNVTNITTSAPLAEGESELVTVDSFGDYPVLDNEMIHVSDSDLPSTIMLSKLNASPNILPIIETTYSNQYWLFRNFDSATSSVSMQLSIDQQFTPDAAQYYKLCMRDKGSVEQWQYAADAVSTSRNVLFTFENVGQTGQFIIGKETRTPVLYSKLPENGAVEVGICPDISLEFDRDIVAGDGNIYVYNGDGTPVIDIPAASATTQGNVASMNISTNLELNSDYYILVDPDAFTLWGNPFAGINLSSGWAFSTMNVSNESGNCLELNGTDEYVEFSDGLIPAAGDFTLSLWAMAEEYQTGYREIVSQVGGAGTNFYLGIASNGNVRVGDDWADTGVAFPLDSGWHYYTVVRDESDTHLYIDGFPMASRGSAIANPEGGEFRIGRQYGTHAEYFQGKVDEIKIWDSALSAHELRLRMHRVADIENENLVSYIQFNNDTDEVLDLIGGKNGYGGGTRSESWVEMGDAETYYVDITETGTTAIDSSGVALTVTEMNSDIRAYATKFIHTPHWTVHDEHVFSAQFWAVHVFSDSTFTTDITLMPSEVIDSYYDSHPNTMFIKSREVNMKYSYWYGQTASNVNSAENSVTMSPMYTNGLFMLSCDVPMTIIDITPPDGSVVPDSVVFAAQFDYMVWLGDGYIRIHRYDDDSTFEDIHLDAVTQNDEMDIIYFDPQNTLEPGVTYYITIDPNCIYGADETEFGGIDNKDYWNFTAEGFGSQDAPQNVAIQKDVTDIVISWDPVNHANSYKVLSCLAPEGTFDDLTGDGAFSTEYDPGRISWICPISLETRRFYKIVGSTDIVRTTRKTKAQKQQTR